MGGADGYPCLKHLIYLWPRNWEDILDMMNEAVCDRNKSELKSGKNIWCRGFKIKSSGNTLGVFFWQWYTVREDKGVG